MDTKSVGNPTLIDELVDDFLKWPLPASVCADGCTTDPKYPHQRVGTNLLSAVEAKQMFEQVVMPKLLPKSDAVAMPERSAEAQFINQDLFAIYVADHVNPARAAAGLDTISEGAARHLYEVIIHGRYLANGRKKDANK